MEGVFSRAVIIVSCILVVFGAFAQEVKKEPLAIGDKVSIHSDILGEERIVNVYVPQGYHSDSSQTYPVIYLLDGSMDEDFIHVAGLVQFLSFSWLGYIPESIVVGIARVDRFRDFTTPPKDQSLKDGYPTAGGSDKFIRFLKEELIPYINDSYKINTDYEILSGQSLGGRLATEVFLDHKEVFDHYMIFSPSLWWDNRVDLSHSDDKYACSNKMFLAVGQEHEIMIQVAEEFRDKIIAASEESACLQYRYYPEMDHGDILHKAMYDGLKYIFEKPSDKK